VVIARKVIARKVMAGQRVTAARGPGMPAEPAQVQVSDRDAEVR
jgi:hypothetical protein